MTYALTLVAADPILTIHHLEKVVEHFDISCENLNWLEENKALDCTLSHSLTISQMQDMRSFLYEDKIDVFCTSFESRKKQLLLADMDSTIVTTETLDEMAEEAGLKDEISHITDRAMKGEIDFFDALRDRVALLENLPQEALIRTLEQTQISLGAASFIKTMRQHNAFCVLVSGGFTFFTQNIAAQLGFNAHHGNILDIQNNVLTGKVIEPILGKEAKLQYLNDYIEQKNISLDKTMAIGDGANDLPLLEAASLGIGYHPKPLLEQRLMNCIRHTDLKSALYIQGYTSKEIAF